MGLLSTTPSPAHEPEEVILDEDEDSMMLETVVVTGSRTEHLLSEAPVATQVITREDIEDSGAQNAADLIEEQPGISIERSYRGSGVQLQGLDAKYVLVLVDGARIPGRIGGAIDLERISVENIERIEIVKGPSSALYGSDSLGGVVNIITRSSQKPLLAETHLTYGSFNALDLSGQAGLRRDDWSSLFTLGWHRADAYDLDPSTVATTGSSLNQWSAANRTEYRLSPGARLKGRVEYLMMDQQGIDANDSGAVFDRRNLTETLLTSLGPEIRLDGGALIQTKASYSLYRDQYVLDQRNSTKRDQDQTTTEQFGQLEGQYTELLFDEHLISVGLEGRYEELQSDRLDGGSADRIQAALFVQDEWTVSETPALVVAPGARLDMDSRLGVHPTPKIALRYDPNDRWVLRMSYGMGFRAPSFKELLLRFENPDRGYAVEGNPELEPETSHSGNVGAEFRPNNELWCSLSLFRNDIDNLIFTETIGEATPNVATRYTYVNIASAMTQGVELYLRARPVAGLRLEGSYALTDTEDRETGRPLEGRALHRGTFTVRYAHSDSGLQASVRGSVVGERPFFVPDPLGEDGDLMEVHAEPYTTLDLRLRQRIGQRKGRHLELFAGVDNLLDAGDAQFLPLQPRTFYGGVTGRL